MSGNEQAKRVVSRRAFLKSAGAIAGTAGVLAASQKALAYGPATEYLPGTLVRSTIRRVDTFPYDISGVRRFDEINTAFGMPAGYAEFKAQFKPTAPEKMKNKVPGYTIVDYSLQSAAWTSQRGAGKVLYSWQPLGVSTPVPGLAPWKCTPEEANILVKKAARVLGAADVGVATLNPAWVYNSVGRATQTPVVLTDEVPSPVQTPEAWKIPNSLKSLIVLIVPMDLQLLQYTPSALGEASVGRGYSHMAEVSSKMAEFIRGIGYQAIPMGNDTILSVPAAIDAGLGEQGRAGILVHPTMGTCLRIAKVLTDMPIAPDKRIEFGVQAFCKSCKKCARECPAGAISMDDDLNEPMRPSNNPGVKKWYVDVWKCHCFWTENGTDCATCQRTCPYNKPQTWLHDVVKGVTATTSVLDPVFIKLDDMMGYGAYYNADDAARFWQTLNWPTKG
jgi:reductive dehalogenase